MASLFKFRSVLLNNRNAGVGFSRIACPSAYASQRNTELPKSTARGMSSGASPSMVGKHFLTLRDFSQAEVQQLLWTAADLKTRLRDGSEVWRPLVGKSMAMIFQKRSTRTRFSTETGMTLLGGHAAFLGPEDIHLGVTENLQDSARVISSMCDVMFARVFGQEDIDTLAKFASVPVISGLTDLYHPLQTLADCLTIYEKYGRTKGLRLAYIGDGNNIVHSLMMGCPKLGINLAIATPKGYEPDSQVMQDCVNLCAEHRVELQHTNDPVEACRGSDVIVTDTWISMHQMEEYERRVRDFAGYQVDAKLVAHAKPDWTFLHSLPRKQHEVTDDIVYDQEHSQVFQAAENRKWTVMAVMLHLLQDYTPTSTPRPKFD